MRLRGANFENHTAVYSLFLSYCKLNPNESLPIIRFLLTILRISSACLVLLSFIFVKRISFVIGSTLKLVMLNTCLLLTKYLLLSSMAKFSLPFFCFTHKPFTILTFCKNSISAFPLLVLPLVRFQ